MSETMNVNVKNKKGCGKFHNITITFIRNRVTLYMDGTQILGFPIRHKKWWEFWKS